MQGRNPLEEIPSQGGSNPLVLREFRPREKEARNSCRSYCSPRKKHAHRKSERKKNPAPENCPNHPSVPYRAKNYSEMFQYEFSASNKQEIKTISH